MYFPLIDILRGFAAVSVVIYHVIEHFHWVDYPSSGPAVWFRIGWIGVDLFFVISGFVVSLSVFGLIDRLGERAFRLPYISRRVARIAPLYYLTGLVFLIFIVPNFFYQANFWPHLLAHLAFVHNLDPDTAASINGANWSIGVEVQFYLVMLLLAPALRTCRWWLIPAVAFPVAWAWRAVVFAWVPISPALGPYTLFWASTQLPGMLDEFALGMLLSRLVRGGWFAEASKRRGICLMAVGGAVVLVWLGLALFWRHASFWDSGWMVIGWRSLCAAACAAAVLAACWQPGPWVMRLTAPLRYAGTISYGVYLWHLPVISSFEHLDWLSGGRALPVVLVLTFLLASGSWHLFELPIMRRLRVGVGL